MPQKMKNDFQLIIKDIDNKVKYRLNNKLLNVKKSQRELLENSIKEQEKYRVLINRSLLHTKI